MLESKVRTPDETKQNMEELKKWLREQKETPAEEMSDFFSRRIGSYDKVHLDHWAEEYRHIADYFEEGLQTLLDIGCGTGLELEAVYRRFPDVRVTGVDLSEAMLKKLRDN